LLQAHLAVENTLDSSREVQASELLSAAQKYIPYDLDSLPTRTSKFKPYSPI
jgi:hypothetical protein